MFASSKHGPYLPTLPPILLYPFKLICILIIDTRLFTLNLSPHSSLIYIYTCVYSTHTHKKNLYILPTLSPPIFPRGGGVSRDSILPPSVCACSTSGARSTNTITPCCISTCTTHDRSLANCLMCSLDRATTCIVCLISHISFTYLYVRVLHLTVCMCQLRPRIRFRCHTLSHAFQCGRIAPAVLALNTTPNRHEALIYKQTHTSHVFHRPGQIAQSPSQTPSPFRSSL